MRPSRLLRNLGKRRENRFTARLRGIAQYITDNYDVAGLCDAFPKRVQMLADASGARVKP